MESIRYWDVCTNISWPGYVCPKGHSRDASPGAGILKFFLESSDIRPSHKRLSGESEGKV